MPRCIQILHTILNRFLIDLGLQNQGKYLPKSMFFLDIFSMSIFDAFGSRFFPFSVSMLLLRRSDFSRRTLCFPEEICFHPFAGRQLKLLSIASKIVLKIDQKSMKNRSKMGSESELFPKSVSRPLSEGSGTDFGRCFGSQIAPKIDSKRSSIWNRFFIDF